MSKIFTYAAAFVDVAVTAAQDLWEIVPITYPVLIHEFTLGQWTEEGDAAAEMLPIAVIRGYTTSGSGGSTVTPRPLNARAPAASITAMEINNTTPAQDGTALTLMAEAWNVQAGYIYRAPLPYPWETFEAYLRRCIVAVPGERVVIRMSGENPADSITMRGTLTFSEIQG